MPLDPFSTQENRQANYLSCTCTVLCRPLLAVPSCNGRGAKTSSLPFPSQTFTSTEWIRSVRIHLPKTSQTLLKNIQIHSCSPQTCWKTSCSSRKHANAVWQKKRSLICCCWQTSCTSRKNKLVHKRPHSLANAKHAASEFPNAPNVHIHKLYLAHSLCIHMQSPNMTKNISFPDVNPPFCSKSPALHK